MIFIIIGCLAFFFFIIFDLNKVLSIHKWINLSFFIGIVLLGLSTVALLFVVFKSSDILTPMQWLAGILSFISLLLMIYTLFLGIPFTKTYMETKKNAVVNTGMYALCRHPGVIWFFCFYLFLSLAFSNIFLLWAAVAWTILDIIYVYIQDCWIFPIILEDYQSYQKQVPFLVPDLTSLRNCIMSFV